MKLHLVLLISVLLISCQNKEPANSIPSNNANADQLSSSPKGVAYENSNTGEVPERKITRNANIRMEVESLQKATDQLHRVVQKYHGYISNEVQSDQEGLKEINTTLRVPSLSLDSLMEDIMPLAIKTDTKNLNTEDVSEEYIDINARLKTKRELEETYLGLLKQAHSVNEVINIEKELTAVRGDIESMEGRLKYLNSQVRYASLEISCYQIIHTSSNFWREIGTGISGGWFGLAKFVILLFRAWPLLILLIILVYFGKRRFRTKN